MKYKLTYIRIPKGTKGCIPESHYDLHTVEKEPSNVACILTNREGAAFIRKLLEIHNATAKEEQLEFDFKGRKKA